ncbi:unnamed protein product [Microthlaspi erraticum]|uniref:Arabidopsis retrotransposon Orf1 C-terminal domain-containing protein n=1 Tax=Microthlaspi erraticum TaxID=1685480 RepID=A0A6D2HGH0_9BRAS|nr:unnamed protein product [Microthlaspi erraticum]
MDIKFCKTNLLIEHKELDGRPPVYTLVGHEDDLREEEPELDRAEDRAESQAEDRVQESADLGEPECYYFEEYEAPRMNPSVVAAHKRIGLLQKFNKWQGKAIERCKSPWTRWSRSLLTTPRRLPAQEPHRASSFEPREGEDNSAEKEEELPRPDAPARPPDSIESKQRKLNSIELRVELTWRSPCLRIRDSSTIPRLTRTSPDLWTPTSFEQASSQGQGSHTLSTMKKRKKRSRKLDRAKFGGANSSSIELGVKTRKVVFWSILEHMGHEEHGGTWHMDAAQLDTQRKKGEAILKTSSTPTRPTGRVPQLDRPSFNSIELRSQQSNPKNVASPLTFL